jgi:Flp pilus assembly protein TadD
MTYADGKRWSGLMEAVTQSRYMPPWLPEPGYGEFQENRRLSNDEIVNLQRWVAGGMPVGDASEAVHAPVYASEWQLGQPDIVLQVTSPEEVPASGPDQFRNFILPVDLQQTRWIRAMEIKPGSPRVVHHANVVIDRTASLRRQHPNDWRKGIPGMDITIDSGSSFDPDSHLLFWKPDSSALIEPEDMPWRLDPGNDLILNMHLKPTGKAETVQARIGLYFAQAPARHLPMLLQLEHDDALDIPAGDAHFVIEDKLTLPEAVEVLAVYPHAHYLGKTMEGYAVLPGGERRWIILIKDWDIERQAIYRLAKPLLLPAHTEIHMRYSYDNSSGNIRNPHAPPERVHAGNRSEDEMGHLWLQVLPVEDAKQGQDPRIPLERAWMENRLTKDPDDITALYNLASIDMEDHRTLSAKARLQHALERRPGDARLLTALGLAEFREGEGPAARREFAAALAGDPAYPDAQFDLARLDFSANDLPSAEKLFHAYVAQAGSDPAGHDGLGATLLAQNRSDEARQEFEAALHLDPKDFDALYNLASIASDAHDPAHARTLLQRALAVSEDADAERMLALLEASQNQMPEAIEHMKVVCTLQPHNPEPRTLLARMYAQQQHWKEAVTEQKAALALNGTHADDWSLLGIMERNAGDDAAAKQAFLKALQIDPHNEAALRATQAK